MGLVFADDLSHLDSSRSDGLPALPVVRGAATAPERDLAELSLTLIHFGSRQKHVFIAYIA